MRAFERQGSASGGGGVGCTVFGLLSSRVEARTAAIERDVLLAWDRKGVGDVGGRVPIAVRDSDGCMTTVDIDNNNINNSKHRPNHGVSESEARMFALPISIDTQDSFQRPYVAFKTSRVAAARCGASDGGTACDACRCLCRRRGRRGHRARGGDDAGPAP